MISLLAISQAAGRMKWLVRVFDKGEHAYNEAFWTRRQALAFMDKITGLGVRWSCELQRIGI